MVDNYLMEKLIKPSIKNIKINSKILILLLFIFSLLPLVWIFNNTQLPFFGESDYISPVNLDTYLQKKIFTYEPIVNGGFNSSFLIAGLIPVGLFMYILSLFHISYAVMSLLFISLLILIAELSMYWFMCDFLRNKLEVHTKHNKYIAFISGIIYAFSPYFASLILPGHFILLLTYSFFPLIILLFDRFLLSPHLDFKILVKLFLIFLLCAAAFSNVGAIYALVVALFSYVLFIAIYEKSIVQTTTRFILVLGIILVSNIWWLLPFILNIKEAVLLATSTNTLTNAINSATKNENIFKLLFGKDDLSLFGSFIIFSYLLFFMCIAILKIQKKFVILYIFMIIVGIFITKGPNEPFSFIFMWLFNHFPGFQIFRRPVSKFYWVYYFFLILLSFSGVVYSNQKQNIKRWLIFGYFPLISIASYFVISFIFMEHPSFFSIPKYYYDAKDYLLDQNVDKILIIPGFLGDVPRYNKTINNYHGDDFIYYIWNIPLMVPDPSAISLETLQKRKVNLLMSQIRQNKSFCKTASEVGLSHIMIRQDVSPSASVEDKPSFLIQLLKNNKDIKHTKYFGTVNGGFTLMTVNNNCRSKIVSLESGDARVLYQYKNPTQILVHISHLNKPDSLILRFNYDKQWKLYLNNKNASVKPQNTSTISSKISDLIIAEISAIGNKSQSIKVSSKMLYGYASSWKLDSKYIRENYSNDYYVNNSDGSIDLNLVIYYNPQRYFYLGLIIEITILAIIIVYLLRKRSIKR